MRKFLSVKCPFFSGRTLSRERERRL